MKRIISLLLTLAMLLGMTACGQPGNTAEQDAPRKKLTIGIANSAKVDWDDNWFTKYMEDRLNCDIELVFFSSDNTEKKSQLATMAAGGEKLPDIIYRFIMNQGEVQVYGDDGYFMDLAPYFDDPEWELAKKYGWHDKMVEYHGEEARQYVLQKYRTAGGNMYYWPSGDPTDEDLTVAMPFINKTWLDKLGLEMPTTREELVEVLRAFKTQDPNENDIADEIPMVGSTSTDLYCCDAPTWLLNTFGEYVYDVFFFTHDEQTGKIDVPYNTEKYREGLRFIRGLVDEGLLAPLTWTMKETAELKQLWTPADGDTTVGVVFGYPTIHAIKGDEDVKQYVPLPPLEDSYVAVRSKGVNTYHYITTDCEDFDLAAEFLMSFCDLDVIRASRRGEEGVDWVEKTDLRTGQPMLQIINPVITEPRNRAWGTHGPAVTWHGDGSPVDEGIFDPAKLNQSVEDMDAETYRNELLKQTVAANVPYAEEHNPKLFFHAVYTPEEEEENGNSVAELKSYVKECRAKFCAGELDPDNEADWNNYLSTLERLGLSTVIRNTQAAVDRLEAQSK